MRIKKPMPLCPKCGVQLRDRRSRTCVSCVDHSPMRGRKLTQEHKNKVSVAMKGRKITWGDKISIARKGVPVGPMSEETKKKLSLALKGRMPKNLSLINANKFGKNNPIHKHIFSQEDRKNMSERGKNMWKTRDREKARSKFSGENNPRWKGGITPILLQIRHSNQTKEWRKSIFERDNYTCQECGGRGGKLNAHHIKSFSEYPELRFEISNGITLCVECHKNTPNYLNRWHKEKELIIK